MGLYKVTLKELYGCEEYLRTGKAIYVINHVPIKYRDMICEELNTSYNRRAFGYFVDEGTLFDYFKQKYPDELARHNIDNYAILLYKAKSTLYRVR